jgi:hypothetical protein
MRRIDRREMLGDGAAEVGEQLRRRMRLSVDGLECLRRPKRKSAEASTTVARARQRPPLAVEHLPTIVADAPCGAAESTTQ